jgi:glycosyltransferase involved in cell wall biosynthesis
MSGLARRYQWLTDGLGRSLRSYWWRISPRILGLRFGERAGTLPAEVLLCGPAVQSAFAWYGSRPFEPTAGKSDRHPESTRMPAAHGEPEFRRATRNIISRYFRVPRRDAPYPCPPFYEPIIGRRRPVDPPARSTHEASSAAPSFTLVTCASGAGLYFGATARSLAAAIATDHRLQPGRSIEWIVASDDPGLTADALRSQIPQAIRDRVIILADGRKMGAATRLNEAIHVSRGEWILFLGCDDIIEPDALGILQAYITELPRCRCIGSFPIDIDEKDRILRFRRASMDAQGRWPRAMNPGGLAAVRRDLFHEVGDLDPGFGTAYDDEFALRVYFHEPLLVIPEHLNRFRWHRDSPLVGETVAVNRARCLLQRRYILRLAAEAAKDHTPSSNMPPQPAHPAPVRRGACIIRTQGLRSDLLMEAIASVENQSMQITPIVVVHGDASTFRDVAASCARQARTAICLHAAAPNRRRGYPANLGLDYVLERMNDYDLVCFLDDDDILYPHFAEKMAAAMTFGQADMAYARANRRKPWQAAVRGHLALPTAGLLVRNFLPINSYCLRLCALAAAKVRFDEEMEYLEDWDFLLSLLDKGLRMKALPETLSEFRVIGDGNTRHKKEPKLYRECQVRIARRCEALGPRLGPSFLYRSIAEFDPSTFTLPELREIERIVRMIEPRFETLVPPSSHDRAHRT